MITGRDNIPQAGREPMRDQRSCKRQAWETLGERAALQRLSKKGKKKTIPLARLIINIPPTCYTEKYMKATEY